MKWDMDSMEYLYLGMCFILGIIVGWVIGQWKKNEHKIKIAEQSRKEGFTRQDILDTISFYKGKPFQAAQKMMDVLGDKKMTSKVDEEGNVVEIGKGYIEVIDDKEKVEDKVEDKEEINQNKATGKTSGKSNQNR